MSIELAFDRVDGARGERTILFLHGILGRGNNLRTIARRFIEARPGWNAWLVDLRGHGKSPKGSAGPSIEAAAQDVVNLATHATLPVGAIIGHSFGGKIALEAARIGDDSSLEHVVVIDSVPGSREPLRTDDSALAITDIIESLPPTFASRSAFIDAIVARGKTPALAQWLAQSLETQGDRVRFALDLDEIRELLQDYFVRDLWPVVEQPPGALQVHLVIGDRSDSYSPADRDQAVRIAKINQHVTVDILPAGHWIHVDDADGLLRTLVNRIGDY